jgi:hypothetical protein
MSTAGNFAPITPLGNVVVNAAFDASFYVEKRSNSETRWPSTKGDSDHVISKNDLVFRWRNGNKRKRAAYNEPELKVFSTCNGMPVSRNTGKDTDEDLTLRESCAFIGVSNNDLVPGPSKHAAVTVAGLITIKNTGAKPIYAGDKVVWDIPLKGEARSRNVFHTKPYETSTKQYTEMVKKSLGALSSGTATKKPEDMKNSQICASEWLKTGLDAAHFDKMATFLQCYCELTKEIDSRVIGTALSSATAGQHMDVLIRYGK